MCDILLIEDDLENASMLSTLLRLSEYSVVVESNGLTAFKYLDKCVKSEKSLPRLIISDVSMPQMDGFEFCYLLKDSKEYFHIPIILYTAVYPELTEKLALTLNPDDYILKPVSNEVLFAKIEEHILKKA